jgi:DNA-binding NarL/FixJ family response regulator
MTTLPKWTDERTVALRDGAGNESPVSRETVARLAEELQTTPRSIAAKLRKLNIEVETVSAAPKAFSDAEAEALTEFVEANENAYTYAEIAENFAGGKFSAKQVQGKILSLELTGLVKPTPKVEAQKSYSDAEEAQVIELVNSGAFVEDIASALNRSVPSIRGKALSLLRAGAINGMPQQRDVKGDAPDAFNALGDVSGMTVADIAEKLGKTERGVKTMLTRRSVAASDYDGAAKAEKAKAAA